jgi:hypothetical protein
MSRSSVSYAVAAAALAAAVGLAAACKSATSNNCGNGGTPPNLVGTYSLLVYTLGTATYTAPTATGNLRFYPGAYHVDANLPTGGSKFLLVLDTGNYNFVGSTCIQEFSVLDSVPPFAGSVHKNADSTLHISGNAGGLLVASTWKETP